jgi:hypothetical protein
MSGEVGLLAALVGRWMSSGSAGFDISRKVFSAEGLRGLSTFGDLLSGEMFFAGVAEGISWGTLQESLRINNKQ